MKLALVMYMRDGVSRGLWLGSKLHCVLVASTKDRYGVLLLSPLLHTHQLLVCLLAVCIHQ